MIEALLIVGGFAYVGFMTYMIGHSNGYDAGVQAQKEVTDIVTRRADAAEKASHGWWSKYIAEMVRKWPI